MKEWKEIKFEDLSVEQKISMVTCAQFDPWNRNPEGDEFIYNCIRNRSLGAVWVYPTTPDYKDIMKKIYEIADYPLLILTDAENGMGPSGTGGHNTIGMADSEELAYEFGKVTAITARNMGYNVVCNPLLDMVKGPSIASGNRRSMGSNKYRVAALAAAIARGMHDGGVLTVGKHYPSAKDNLDRPIDSHMAEALSPVTKDELIDYCLYPYLELMKEGLLDGVMTSHTRIPNIDPDYPASLSKKVIGIIRELGFDGFAITDGLSMMGIVAKFGDSDSKGMSIENGNDIALVGGRNYKKMYNMVYDCYKKGILTEQRLDEATRHVLAAQHKVYEMQPKFTEVTEEDIQAMETLSKNAVFAKTDDGKDPTVSRDGRHLFIVMADIDDQLNEKQLPIDTFTQRWYEPSYFVERFNELFPNSEVAVVKEFPTANVIQRTLRKAVDFEDVVYVTVTHGRAYGGREEFAPPFISLIEAMQVSDQVSAIVHFGSPYALEPLPHIPTIIYSTSSRRGVDAALDVLAGNYPAKGTLTYDVKFE